MTFRICDQKGFHITFENGWTVSVQFGRGNYGSNYNHSDYGSPVPPAIEAELAAWPPNGEMIAFENGDTVKAYQTATDALALMNRIAAMPASGIAARSDETAQQAQPEARARPDAHPVGPSKGLTP